MVFLTGATGFIGSYLARLLLRKGYEVRALRRATSQLDMLGDAANQIDWVEGDILDVSLLEEAMDGVEQVYHVAAIVAYDPRQFKKMKTVNVQGTANVVNVAMYREVKKLVHISSIAAVGNPRAGEAADEKTSWKRDKKNTGYSITKFLSEQEVWRGHAEGLPMAIVNPSVVLGAGRWTNSSLALFKRVWDGLPFYSTGGTGFVDVRDVTRMAVQLMESDMEGQRFIANAENWSYQKLFTQIAGGLGKQPPHIKVTPFIAGVAWRWEWLKSLVTRKAPLITRETAASSARTTLYDNQKSLTALNFDYIPIEQTIRETTALMKVAAGKTRLLEV